MYRLGHYILSDRAQAVITLVLLTITSFFLPPFAYILGGLPLCFLTLIKGSRESLQVCMLAACVLVLLSLFVQIPLIMIASYLVCIWLPIWVCAMILRLSKRQSFLIIGAGVWTIMLLAVFYFVLGGEDIWQDSINLFIDNSIPLAKQDDYRQLLLSQQSFLSVFLAFAFLLNLVGVVLLARFWQSRLFNPGGFRQEFYNLKLPVFLLILLGLGMVVSQFEGLPLFIRDCLIIVCVLFLFQGVSLMHRFLGEFKYSSQWLFIAYTVLFLQPITMLLVICLGVVHCGFMAWKVKRME